MTIGIRVKDDVIVDVIYIGTAIPIVKSIMYYPKPSNFSEEPTVFEVVGGYDYKILGQFQLYGKALNNPQFQIDFLMNENKVLNITVVDLDSGRYGNIEISNYSGIEQQMEGAKLPSKETRRPQSYTPMSIGIRVKDDVTVDLIYAGTAIPIAKSIMYYPKPSDFFEEPTIFEVIGGYDYKIIEQFKLYGKAFSNPRFRIDFSMNENKVLNITVVDLDSGRCSKIEISKYTAMEQHADYKYDNSSRDSRSSEIDQIKQLISIVKYAVRDGNLRAKISVISKQEMNSMAYEIEDWMKLSQDASLGELQLKHAKLQAVIREQIPSDTSHGGWRDEMGQVDNAFPLPQILVSTRAFHMYYFSHACIICNPECIKYAGIINQET